MITIKKAVINKIMDKKMERWVRKNNPSIYQSFNGLKKLYKKLKHTP